jgi:hypothetical protein
MTNSIRLIDLLAVLTLVMFSFAGCKKTIAFISINFDKTSLTLALTMLEARNELWNYFQGYPYN